MFIRQNRIQARTGQTPQEKTMKKILIPAALISSALFLAACGGSAPASTPTIVSVSPALGSLGNADTTQIVINFSEAMDTTNTQAAYNSASVGIRQAFGEVTYSWSNGNKTLTIIPNNPLTYNIAPAAPNNYAFYISTAAKSAAGVPLASQYNGNFNTYVKHLNEVLYTDPTRDANVTGGFLSGIYTVLPPAATMTIGDDILNSTQAAYLTFSLAGLPGDLQTGNILAADLAVTPSAPPVGAPYTILNMATKKLVVHGLNYGNAVDLPELLPNNELVTNLDGTLMNGSVLSAVKADWTNKAVQNSLSQYQLRFAQITAAPFTTNQAYIFSGDPLNTVSRPQLTLTYLSNN